MKKGFTLIELVLVIAVLGVLVVSALPNYINTSTQTEIVLRDAVVGAIRSGIALERAKQMNSDGSGSYPAALDSVGADTPCGTGASVRCFEAILPLGVTSPAWIKVNEKHYTFNDGTTTYTYTYDPSTGSFTSPTAP